MIVDFLRAKSARANRLKFSRVRNWVDSPESPSRIGDCEIYRAMRSVGFYYSDGEFLRIRRKKHPQFERIGRFSWRIRVV